MPKRHLIIIAATLCVFATEAISAEAFSPAEVSQLKAQVAALQPAANAQVATAARQGRLGALVRSVEAQGLNAQGGTTPEQYALATALGTYGRLSSQQGSTGIVGPARRARRPARRPARPRAHAAGCWRSFSGSSHIWRSASWNEAGIAVAHWEKDHGWWCGNGYGITSNGLPGYYASHDWATPPWCLVLEHDDQGWDAPHEAWAHGRLLGKVGTWTPWDTCPTFLGSRTVVVRINANGGWDTYNDY